jgi:hypothetical protein
MSHDLKKFLGKDYPTLSLILGHYMRNPPKITLSEPTVFMQNAQASRFHYPNILARAFTRNNWISSM